MFHVTRIMYVTKYISLVYAFLFGVYGLFLSFSQTICYRLNTKAPRWKLNTLFLYVMGACHCYE